MVQPEAKLNRFVTFYEFSDGTYDIIASDRDEFPQGREISAEEALCAFYKFLSLTTPADPGSV